MWATMPMPVGPPPSGFLEGVFMPQQYQQVPPPVMVGYGPGNYPPGVPDVQGADNTQGIAHAQGYNYAQSYGHPLGYQPPVPEQRIVYVPYATPPPINVERLGKALSRPMIVRRMLGDAYMYEYPEMPIRPYTTRGPRDFLAPNPPGIGY
jgi:hypothetical protein